MRMVQNARIMPVIDAFILLWCVRQMHMVQNAIIILLKFVWFKMQYNVFCQKQREENIDCTSNTQR